MTERDYDMFAGITSAVQTSRPASQTLDDLRSLQDEIDIFVELLESNVEDEACQGE